MAKFDLRKYGLSLLRVYKNKDKELEHLLEDLDYYMLDTKDKNKYLYFVVTKEKDIYICWDRYNSEWDEDKLSLIISNSLRNSTFMHIYISGYNGVMMTDFWDNLKSSSDYFENVKKFRKELKKIEQSEIIVEKENNSSLTIDEILNKINEKGIDSLTDEEKEILNNSKNK